MSYQYFRFTNHTGIRCTLRRYRDEDIEFCDIPATHYTFAGCDLDEQVGDMEIVGMIFTCDRHFDSINAEAVRNIKAPAISSGGAE